MKKSTPEIEKAKQEGRREVSRWVDAALVCLPANKIALEEKWKSYLKEKELK